MYVQVASDTNVLIALDQPMKIQKISACFVTGSEK
jgi:hypothetical protein